LHPSEQDVEPLASSPETRASASLIATPMTWEFRIIARLASAKAENAPSVIARGHVSRTASLTHACRVSMIQAVRLSSINVPMASKLPYFARSGHRLNGG